MDLETLIASSCRRRILRVLSKSGMVNVMTLVIKVNSTYNQVNANLRVLREAGIIFDEHFGRARVIKLNKDNPRTMLLLQALKTLNSSQNHQVN
jgi:predicted transcriptional regulator